MNVSSSPMPAAVAERSDDGMAIAMRSRSGVIDTSRKTTPAQKMMPSATGHGTPPLMINVYVKNALRPMPGATPNGSRAYTPINNVIVKQTRTVAVSAPEKGMPVPGDDRIAG